MTEEAYGPPVPETLGNGFFTPGKSLVEDGVMEDVIEAGKITARLVPFDPELWLKCADTAGMDVYLLGGKFSIDFRDDMNNKENLFLMGWMNNSPGAKAAVKALLVA